MDSSKGSIGERGGDVALEGEGAQAGFFLSFFSV